MTLHRRRSNTAVRLMREVVSDIVCCQDHYRAKSLQSVQLSAALVNSLPMGIPMLSGSSGAYHENNKRSHGTKVEKRRSRDICEHHSRSLGYEEKTLSCNQGKTFCGEARKTHCPLKANPCLLVNWRTEELNSALGVARAAGRVCTHTRLLRPLSGKM